MYAPPTIGLVFSSARNLENVTQALHAQDCRLVGVVLDLEDAVAPVRELIEEQGVEVVLSRRGTAHILQQHLPIPVVSLPETTASQLRAVKHALSMGSRIGITQNVTGECNVSLCQELLGVTPEIIYYEDKKSLEAGIGRAKEAGLEVVIGGDITRRAAQKFALPFVDLHEYFEIPKSFFDSIVNIVQTRRKTLQEKERYRAILNAVSEAIVAVDATGTIEEINTQAGALLRGSAHSLVGNPIDAFFPSSALHEAYSQNRRLSNITAQSKHQVQVMINAIPIRVGKTSAGAVYSMQPAARILKAEERVRQSYAARLKARYSMENFWHQSSAVAAMLKQAQVYAASDAAVCITGESGTGKEILAQAIHNCSLRKAGPFVPINCAAMPEQLLESELFGYAEGAFTGSRRGGKIGIFELAHGGTLFLDEVGTISASFQTRLLRALQEKEIMRLGSNVMVPADVRIITAGNNDMCEDVRTGKLRSDLFYRLHVLPLHIPPLRQRREDIPLLMQEFLETFAAQYQRPPLQLDSRHFQKLQSFSWPGNVRQLRSFAERLAIVCTEGFDAQIFHTLLDCLHQECPLPAVQLPREMRKSHGPEDVQKALQSCGGSKSQAARALGISRSTLWRLLKEKA